MPLYTYACKKCRHEFEALVFAGDEPKCPQCAGRSLEQRLSLPARPPAEKSSAGVACNSSGPPCGPACRRFSNS